MFSSSHFMPLNNLDSSTEQTDEKHTYNNNIQ